MNAYRRIADIQPYGKGLLDAKIAVCRHLGITICKIHHGAKQIRRDEVKRLWDYVVARWNKEVDGPEWPRPEDRQISLTDQELVDELRKRGYEVTCTKTTTITL
jgi:hypothetical protein